MGEVYRARDTRPELAREVAIKILSGAASDPERRRRFELEARTTGALNHPNVLAIYDIGTYEGTLYLVEELLDGTTLRGPLAHGPLPTRKAVEYARAIAQGLAAAHAKGITHRDLKPENVMLTADGRVKIVDFGLAKLHERAPTPESGTRMHSTDAGTVLGTVAYMSPEQVRGQAVDSRSDIFSLGVVLYEMLAGARPFKGETAADTQATILNAEPPDLPTAERAMPPTLERVVRRCLEKQPEQRFQSASDLGFALEALSTTSSTSSSFSTTSGTATVGPAGRGWVRAGWMSAAALASGVAIGFAIAALRAGPTEDTQGSIQFTQALPTLAKIPTAIANSVPDPALSPDGKQLAFAAPRVRGGTSVLWVRVLAAADAGVIDGTDGASYPFWSPDSRSIGFFSGGKLKVVSVDGSRIREVSDAPGGTGGTWNAEDVILFASAANPGIVRVSANGGQPSAVTTPNAERHERTHRVPSFLPGGQRFLYWNQTEQGGAVMAGSLDGGPPVQLVTSASKAEYSMGHLLYMEGSTLTAQRFDPDTLALSAPAIALVPNVLHIRVAGTAAFSVSAVGLLTYRTLTSDVFQMTWVDRSGRTGTAIGDPGPWVQMALSPDDRRLAVQRDNTAASDIWLFDLVRSVSSKFTVDGWNNGPVWSPDGSELAFRNNRRVLNEVFRKPLSGGDAVAWRGIPAKPLEDWSRDGRYLVMDNPFSDGQRTAGGILVVPASGDGKPVVFASAATTDEPQMSPDGRWISHFSTISGSAQIYLQPFPGPGERVTVSSGGGVQAKWRGDSKEFFYLTLDGTMMSVEMAPGARPDVGTPKPLFRTRLSSPNTAVDQYVVTSDGQRFIVMEPTADAPPESLTIVTNWTTLLKK